MRLIYDQHARIGSQREWVLFEARRDANFGTTIAYRPKVPANNGQSEMDAAVTELRGYVSWQHPFRDVKICFHPNVVRAISSEALSSRRKRPPSEIGGIFWGILPSGPGKPILITNAELVPSQGELYNSTPADVVNLSGRVRNRQPPIAGTAVVGYFRSDVREAPSVRPQDREFIEQELRDPNAIFLIIEPFEIGICMAAFYFWQDGCLQTDASELEVPLIPREQSLGGEPGQQQEFLTAFEAPARPVIQDVLPETRNEPAPAVKARSAAAVVQPESARIDNVGPSKKEETPAPLLLAARPKWPPQPLLTTILSFLVVLATASITYVYFAWPALRARYVHSQIGLEASRSADQQFSLSWNRNSSVLEQAKGAKLTITDGPLSRELPLDNAQLRSGKILYSTHAPQVQFRLEVYRQNGKSMTESVRAGTPTIQPPSTTDSARLTLKSRLSSLPINVARSTKAITSELRRLRTSAPAGGKRLQSTVLEPLHPAKERIYNPAHPIRQVIPDTRPLGRTIPDGTHVSIMVRVDESGHVMSAEIADRTSGVDSSLLNASLSAASAWQFQPAMLNDRPAPSEHLIVFNFHSTSE